MSRTKSGEITAFTSQVTGQLSGDFGEGSGGGLLMFMQQHCAAVASYAIFGVLRVPPVRAVSGLGSSVRAPISNDRTRVDRVGAAAEPVDLV